MTAYLLLAAVAWAVATRGGTSLRDLLVVLLLLGVAAVASRLRPRPAAAPAVAVVVLLGWLVVAGPLRTGLTVESVRVPLLVVAAVLTVLVVRRLSVDERETLVTGLVALGCAHAIIALIELAVTAPGLAVPPRADSLLGSANGLGMLLVATSVLTARMVGRRGGWLPGAALLVQGCALLATGSRTAVVVASVLLVGYAATRADRLLRVGAAAGVAVGAAVLVWRFATEPPEQRLFLWQQALGRIADRPLLGEGPVAAPFATSAPGARVTTHAHNELLQWGVEYGLVGVALGVLALVVALRSARPLGPGDRWILVAALALLAAGLTDFTLRITALTVTAAALGGLATRPDRAWQEPGLRRSLRLTGRALVHARGRTAR